MCRLIRPMYGRRIRIALFQFFKWRYTQMTGIKYLSRRIERHVPPRYKQYYRFVTIYSSGSMYIEVYFNNVLMMSIVPSDDGVHVDLYAIHRFYHSSNIREFDVINDIINTLLERRHRYITKINRIR
jgi:hypothetical protein